MPIYTYRREDGSRFDIKQSFQDPPLEICPESGQPVVRVVQPVGIVFKGSGFYVNDSKAVKSANGAKTEKSESENGASGEDKGEDKKETKSEAKNTEAKTKTETKPAPKETTPAAS